jgi:tetratricopeptide (TPR) repeat protein
MKVVWSAGLALTVILFLGACEPMEQDYAAYPSLDVSPLPEAAVAPIGPLQDAAKNLEAGQFKEAVKLLSAMQPVTPMEKAWHRLLLGQAYFEIGAAEKALRLLLANYEELRDARPAPEPERSLILARSLKKLGAYYRDQEDYDRAYTMHQLQWLYMRRVGSLTDRFDALISLDVDAALLRNYFASEQWLREALLVAQQMPEGLERQRSLIIVWNNVALSLSELLRFQEADAAARESRRISQLYDPASGKKEFREVLAVAQLAEVQGAWARFTEAKNPAESRPLYDKARALAVEALALAEQQGMGETRRAKLEQEMRRYCGQSCRP